MPIIYNNLSQCLNGRLVYFRSTDVEQKNYHRLLWSVPDEWFYLLFLGKSIIIKDKSSNKGKIEHIFIPVLNDVLNFYLFDEIPKNKNLISHFDLACNEIESDKSLKTKILFWKGKISKPIYIKGKTIRVSKELNPLN